MILDESYDSFISYSRKDEQLVKPIYQLLQHGNRRVFWDVHDINPGERWHNKIEESLAVSKSLVLLWCCDTATSEYVSFEIKTALSNNVPIVPVLLCPYPLSESVRDWQWIDLCATINHRCPVDHPRMPASSEAQALGDAVAGLSAPDMTTAAKSIPEPSRSVALTITGLIQMQKLVSFERDLLGAVRRAQAGGQQMSAASAS